MHTVFEMSDPFGPTTTGDFSFKSNFVELSCFYCVLSATVSNCKQTAVHQWPQGGITDLTLVTLSFPGRSSETAGR